MIRQRRRQRNNDNIVLVTKLWCWWHLLTMVHSFGVVHRIHHAVVRTTVPSLSPLLLGVVRSSMLQNEERQTHDVDYTTNMTPTTSTATTAVATMNEGAVVFTPWELWCAQQLRTKYEQALSIKCPFFRRRAADLLDASDMIVRFIVYRHKSLPFDPPGWKCQNDNTPKRVGISTSDLVSAIQQDWKVETHKGYYVTGKLTTAIYRDDAVFDGPDPDMPVRGLRKYLNAASQLFDQSKSRSELLSLDIVPTTSNAADGEAQSVSSKQQRCVIVARWKMQGVLRLPWKPVVPEWTGTTTYYTDDSGLIYRHEETWDKSVWRAFMETLCPTIASRIWSV